eukprot:s144_g8.t1
MKFHDHVLQLEFARGLHLRCGHNALAAMCGKNTAVRKNSQVEHRQREHLPCLTMVEQGNYGCCYYFRASNLPTMWIRMMRTEAAWAEVWTSAFRDCLCATCLPVSHRYLPRVHCHRHGSAVSLWAPGFCQMDSLKPR